MQIKKSKRQHADPTREKILRAALKQFSLKGFEGSSMQQIARDAGVAKSLLFHHFDNKICLWRDAKEYYAQDMQLLTNQQDLDVQHLSLSDFIENFVGSRFKLYQEHPDLIRMLMWQKLSDEKETLIGSNSYSREHVISLIEQLQAAGTIRDDYDATLILILISSSTTGIFNYQSKHFNNKKKQQEYYEMVFECLLNALKPQ